MPYHGHVIHSNLRKMRPHRLPTRKAIPDSTLSPGGSQETDRFEASPASSDSGRFRKIATEAAYWSRKLALNVASVAAGLFGVGFGLSPARLTGADQLHKQGIDGSGVRVAILDQGFTKFGAGSEDMLGVYDTRTREFTEGLKESKSDVVGEIATGRKGMSFHGNAMSCIITGESMGLRGVAPGAELIGVSVLNEERQLTPEKFLEGLQWVADNHREQGIKVISASVNYPRPSPEVRNKTQALVKTLRQEGVSLVVAAGNKGPHPGTISFPADLEGVVSVGAVTQGWSSSDWDDRVERYSSRGGEGKPGPALMAPGGDMFTKDNHGLIELTRGTSNSAPMVAGGLALLSQAFPEATSAQKEQALFNTAQALTGDPAIEGHGALRIVSAHNILKD